MHLKKDWLGLWKGFKSHEEPSRGATAGLVFFLSASVYKKTSFLSSMRSLEGMEDRSDRPWKGSAAFPNRWWLQTTVVPLKQNKQKPKSKKKAHQGKKKKKKKKGVRSEGFGKNRKAGSLFVLRPNLQVSFTASQAGVVLIWKHISNPGIWGLENNGVCLSLKSPNCPFWAEIRSKRKWKQKWRPWFLSFCSCCSSLV